MNELIKNPKKKTSPVYGFNPTEVAPADLSTTKDPTTVTTVTTTHFALK